MMATGSQKILEEKKLESALKIDEVKRLEKIFEVSKESFAFSETVIKTLEDKSRNNITTVAAISGFAFLIRKPAEISQYDLPALAIIGSIILVVGLTYWLHFEATKPRVSSMTDPEVLRELFDGYNYPVGIIKFSSDTLQLLYTGNIKLIETKGYYVQHQHIGLGFALALALLYILFGNVTPPQVGGGGVSTSAASLY